MQHSHVVIEVFNEVPVGLSLVQVLGERLLHPLTLLPQVCHQVLQVGNHSQPTLKGGEFNSSISTFSYASTDGAAKYCQKFVQKKQCPG